MRTRTRIPLPWNATAALTSIAGMLMMRRGASGGSSAGGCSLGGRRPSARVSRLSEVPRDAVEAPFGWLGLERVVLLFDLDGAVEA